MSESGVEELTKLVAEAVNASEKAKDGVKEDVESALSSLKDLKDFKVTTQLLVDTQGGKKLRALTKHQDLDIKATAAEILNVWKGTVSAEAQAIEKTKQQLGGLQPVDPPVRPGPGPLQTSSSLISSDSLKPSGSLKFSDSFPVLGSQDSGLGLPSAKRQKIAESASFLLSPKSIASPHSVNDKIKTQSGQTPTSKKLKIPQTSDQARNKIRQQIADALNLASQDCPDSEPGERAAELETAVFNQNKGVNPKYKAKIRSLWVNLKDPKNPDFRASVLTGEVSGNEAVDLKPEEMASKKRQEENQKIRDAAMFEAERGQKRMATTDQFQCGKCKERKTSYYQMQTRSADEPMTTFVICQANSLPNFNIHSKVTCPVWEAS